MRKIWGWWRYCGEVVPSPSPNDPYAKYLDALSRLGRRWV